MKSYNYFNDNRFVINVTDETCMLTPHTFHINDNRTEEEKSIKYFYSNVPLDRPVNIIDCGAQSGLYSLYAKYLPNATFYSFEPFVTTFGLLNDNIRLNNLTNVKTYNIGLSDKPGRSVLNTCTSHNGLHTMGNNVKRFVDIQPTEIEVNAIDNLFYDMDIPVDFIKIDTEGWELFILKGAEKTIRKYKPQIQIEWNQINMIQCNVDVNELINYIDYIGYKIQNVTGEEAFIVPRSEIDNFKNIPDHITHVKLDIGLSYSAPQSNDWLCCEPNLFVFGFEPNPDAVNCIMNKNIQKRHECHGEPLKDEFIDTRFRLLPVALSNIEKPTNMNFYAMSNDIGTSSLYEPIDISLGPIKSQLKVPVYSLKHFFDVFPWNRFAYIDYIKIDAQGSDFDIIKGAGEYLKNRVVFITAEPESAQYNGCDNNTAHNMSTYLQSQGFIRIAHPNTSDPTFLNLKYSHLYDKIYIRQLS